jgi:cation diffusion facilitator family transporter
LLGAGKPYHSRPMHESHDDGHRVRGRRRIRAVGVALSCSGLVGAAEIVIGLVFRLESVFAEGLHTLADMLDSAVALWAVRKAAEPPDKAHPFGHGKFESIAALVEGVVIAATGGAICWSATHAFLFGQPAPDFAAPAMAAMAVAAVFYAVVSTWLNREARQTASPAVFAEAAHLRTHIYITGGLFAGLLLGRVLDWPRIDALMALAVGGVLLKTAWEVLKPAFGQLTDRALPEEQLRAIAEELDQFRGEFIEMHDVRSRAAGVERHLDVHLVVSPHMTVRSSHELCDRIEHAIARRFPDTFVTIHVEPAESATEGSDKSGRVLIAGKPEASQESAPASE